MISEYKGLREQSRKDFRSSERTPKTKLAMALAAAMITTGAAQASHNNPWAGEDDVVLEQFHDANQEKSVGTSGQDEMRGVMTRNAHGKLGGTDRGPAGQGGKGRKP